MSIITDLFQANVQSFNYWKSFFNKTTINTLATPTGVVYDTLFGDVTIGENTAKTLGISSIAMIGILAYLFMKKF